MIRRSYLMSLIVGGVIFLIILLSSNPDFSFLFYSSNISYLPLTRSNASTIPNPFSILSDSDTHILMDLSTFEYLTVPPICSVNTLVAVAVHSAPNNSFNRQTIRRTWGSQLRTVVFFIGLTLSTDKNNALIKEARLHKDIVLGSFVDSYRNLTYKHVMLLKWVTYYCRDAKYVLKTDDDTFVNTPRFLKFLNTNLSPFGARKLIMCPVLYQAWVRRSYRSKWRVTYDEYKYRYYPSYCMGWVILYSPDVIFLLYAEAQKTRYFWIDDVFVTGILAEKINITHSPLRNLALTEAVTNSITELKPRTDYLFGLSHPSHFDVLWKLINNSPNSEIS